MQKQYFVHYIYPHPLLTDFDDPSSPYFFIMMLIYVDLLWYIFSIKISVYTRILVVNWLSYLRYPLWGHTA
jgi:hypothetical protein